MPYEVKLDVFEGPLDLLLNLITRQRVDIYEVSLATITDEYLAALKRVGDLDLESATGFLVVAATLLELKSARLLPSRHDQEGDVRLLEERDLLLARLVECATFREAGTWIHAGLERGESFHPRSVKLEEAYAALAPEVRLELKLAQVVNAAEILLADPPRTVDVSHIAPIRASVRDAIIEISGVLERRGGATFAELSIGAETRIEIVVRFLGLLELLKVGAVELSQHDRFGEIRATWTGADVSLEALEEVEEYTGAAEVERT